MRPYFVTIRTPEGNPDVAMPTSRVRRVVEISNTACQVYLDGGHSEGFRANASLDEVVAALNGEEVEHDRSA